MKFNVFDEVGENAITVEDGQRLFRLIQPELLAGRPVELDFTRVTVFASPFFNAAIGQLLRELKPENLNQLLELQGLTATGREMMKRVIDNAKRFYSSSDYQKIQDEVFEKFASEN
jgi:hypothetical protein